MRYSILLGGLRPTRPLAFSGGEGFALFRRPPQTESYDGLCPSNSPCREYWNWSEAKHISKFGPQTSYGQSFVKHNYCCEWWSFTEYVWISVSNHFVFMRLFRSNQFPMNIIEYQECQNTEAFRNPTNQPKVTLLRKRVSFRSEDRAASGVARFICQLSSPA